MTMEFLTLSDTRAKNPYSITRAILQTVVLTSELLRRLSWTSADKYEFEYEQFNLDVESNWVSPGTLMQKAKIEVTTVIAALRQNVRKVSGTMQNDVLITETIMDMARDLEQAALGNETSTLAGLTDLLVTSRRDLLTTPGGDVAPRQAAGTDLDLLVSRLGRYWDANECVFLMDSDLCMHLYSLKVVNYDENTRKYTYRSASVIMTDSSAFRGKIALVSVNPAHGLFGIGKGQITDCPYKDGRVGGPAMDHFGPVMGWQIEAGIKEKADPNRPEEVAVADEDGMFETVQISWTGAFGLKNQNAAATIEGLTAPDDLDPTKTPAETMHASMQSDLFPPKS